MDMCANYLVRGGAWVSKSRACAHTHDIEVFGVNIQGWRQRRGRGGDCPPIF